MRDLDSDLERLVADELERVGIETGSCPDVLLGRPDFILRGLRIAVFVHGCYWHRHFKCPITSRRGTALGTRAERLARSVMRDEYVRRELRRAGWSIAILWECSLRQDLPSVINNLRTQVQSSVGGIEQSTPWVYVA